MKPISEATTRVTNRNFSRKFISIGRIVNAWQEIMGESLATKATPNRIQYRKPRTKKDKPIAILEIAASPSDSTIMHYQKGIILERINQIFGEAWITDIKFVALERNTLTTKRASYKRPLSASEKNDLSNTLATIDDPLIYERLKSLGEGIMRKDTNDQ